MEDEVVELEYHKPFKYIDWKDALSLAEDIFAPVQQLGSNYIDNLCAYVSKSKIKDPYTGQELDPDEKLMRAVEGEIKVHEALVDDFRRNIAAQIGTMAYRNKKFKWDSNPQLAKAFLSIFSHFRIRK